MNAAEGHGGGDAGLMDAFTGAVASGNRELIMSGPRESLASHLAVFAAERARLNGTVETIPPHPGLGLPRRLPGPPPYSQGTQDKGTEEHGNADEQQIQQALDDDTQETEHDRHDYEEEEESKHLMLRSVASVTGGPVAVHRRSPADTSGRSA